MPSERPLALYERFRLASQISAAIAIDAGATTYSTHPSGG